MQTQLKIAMPDDWHLHLRNGEVLSKVLPFTTRHFQRAIVMPNLQPPVLTSQDALNYRAEILANTPSEHQFDPLMVLYLTEQTSPLDVKEGFLAGNISAVKLYPAGATTNSDAGVTDIEKIYPVLEVMQEIGMPFLVHGEVVDANVDIFDREAVFIDEKLIPIRNKFPTLKIVFEHITTKNGVDYVKSCNSNTAATITTHHLVINRNAMLVGGIQPHYYCLPVAKRELHRLALREAATSGDSHFFLGTDSAPHLAHNKETACGCAGIFNVANTMGILAEVFEQEGKLENLEKFTSVNGPTFYQLPINAKKMVLSRQESPIALPEDVATDQGVIKVFDPQMPVHWEVTSVNTI